MTNRRKRMLCSNTGRTLMAYSGLIPIQRNNVIELTGLSMCIGAAPTALPSYRACRAVEPIRLLPQYGFRLHRSTNSSHANSQQTKQNENIKYGFI